MELPVMNRPPKPKWVLTTVVALAMLAALSTSLLTSCGNSQGPVVVRGPGTTDNDRPALTITEPVVNLTRGRGDRFLIRWTDSDRDSNAEISFLLVNTVTNQRILLVEGIAENDTVGPDSFSASTGLVPEGTYNILGRIEDEVNPVVEVYAQTAAATPERVVLTVAAPGVVPPTIPPEVFVTQPAFDQSVAQDDTLRVSVQPSELVPPDADAGIGGDAAAPAFDPDSSMTLYVLLDLDTDPNNDDPANPNRGTNGQLTRDDIIVLATQTVEEGFREAISFEIPIDLETIPARSSGDPYHIRATVDDGTNPRVHQYAAGTISVVELAAGQVDLFTIGRSRSGAAFYGFNPSANLGSKIAGVSDFDADGIDDFVMVAQYGNPRNAGQVGEAYLIYGVQDTRFGGSLPANSVAETISGVIFEGPPVRTSPGGIPIAGEAFTLGITDVDWVRDISFDGRPEILWGLPRVHGAVETQDFDPGDEDIGSEDITEAVSIVVRQGEVTVTRGTSVEVTDPAYNGVDDLTISTLSPNTPNGSGSLGFQNDGDSVQEWTLIKFVDLLDPDHIPDSLANIDITSLNATLQLRVFDTGGEGRVFQSLTDFTEQTTYATYAEGGGDPELGVDYVNPGGGDGSLGTLSGDSRDIVEINVTPIVADLIERNLGGQNNELRLIFVPSEEEGADRTGLRSSEYSISQTDRPTLVINYNTRSRLGASGCYPDDLVNNRSNEESVSPDIYWYAGGCAVVLNSQNRDNQDVTGINQTRLEETSVALELVGQEGYVLDGSGLNQAGGDIFPQADNAGADPLLGEPSEPGHISGWRIAAGPFDYLDHRQLNQPGRAGLFGNSVASIGDLDNDGLDEVIISAPRNELYQIELQERYGFQSTHLQSTLWEGSILVVPGNNYNRIQWRDKNVLNTSTSSFPLLDHFRAPPTGLCSRGEPRSQYLMAGTFEVYSEAAGTDRTDMLGDAQSAGDFNQDGLDDILCGAYLNDRSIGQDTGATYILYGRNVLGDFDLRFADDAVRRTPMLRVRGVRDNDQIGWRQATGLDVNGDRVDDVFFSSPRADFGGVSRASCGGDYNRDGVVDEVDLDFNLFNNCRDAFGDHVFTDDACKSFDYDNDTDIDDDDLLVFTCLLNEGDDCCANLVDNGFVGVIFGGRFIDGDRDITQLATTDLPGAIFYGAGAGHRAGHDISSAGDFNQDGFGDLLIAAPGQTWLDNNGRERLGVVYLVFGGTHLTNSRWNLADVGSEDLPGIIFYSPFVKGRPNEAAPTAVGFLGDINDDGFGDIAIGNPEADFIDLSYPQGPNAPGEDAAAGRRSDAGNVYVIYGNNFGSNRSTP
jgi:hypothetical protein